MEMMLMARNISAEEGKRIGLINAVVEDVQGEADKWTSTIASYSPAAVQATKRLAIFPRRISETENTEIAAARTWIETKDDYKDGAAAFEQKA